MQTSEIHALIVGPRGVGKSTLINRVLKELGTAVCGFETKKENNLSDPELGSPIYIYDAWAERVQTPENMLGYCKNHHSAPVKEAFNRFAPKLYGPFPDDAVILMDEIGFMESEAKDFCQAVLDVLSGSRPAIAAVKDKDFPFLEQVRSHPNAKCFYITEENRDALFEEVLAFMKSSVYREEMQIWQKRR